MMVVNGLVVHGSSLYCHKYASVRVVVAFAEVFSSVASCEQTCWSRQCLLVGIV
jgi:hypothetical protein